MKDLEKLVKECEEDIKSLGIRLGNIDCISTNTRAKSRWGICKYRRATNSFSIEINECLLQDDVDDMATKNTIIHELLHAIEGGKGLRHTGDWLRYAKMLNDIYGYNIKRCTSAKEKGLTSQPTNYKYLLVCKNCNFQSKYARMSRTVRDIKNGIVNRYRCPICHKSNYLTIYNIPKKEAI